MSTMLRMPSYNAAGANKEKRIGVPFAPSQSAVGSGSGQSQSSTSRTLSDGTALVSTLIKHIFSCVYATFISRLQQQWRPVKLRSYERDEKSELRRTQSKLSLLPQSVPATPSSARGGSSRRPTLVPQHDGRDLQDIFEVGDTPRSVVKESLSSGFSAKQQPVLRIRSQSENPDESLSTAGGSSSNSSRRGISSSQQSAMRNSAHVMEGHLSSRLFAFLPEGKLLFSCGHWDHSLRATSTESGRLVQSVCQHSDVITCVALAKDFGQTWLVTGSRDCTLMVWAVNAASDIPLSEHPLHTLCGHDDAVTSVAVSPELDVVVSGSEDGTAIVHNLRDGTYVRSIIGGLKSAAPLKTISDGSALDFRDRSISVDDAFADNSWQQGAGLNSGLSTPGLSRTTSGTAGSSVSGSVAGQSQAHQQHQQQRRKITWVGLSKENYIVTYSAEDLLLCTYTLNGFQVATHAVPEALYAFLISEDGRVLITGGSSCLVVFRWVRVQLILNAMRIIN